MINVDLQALPWVLLLIALLFFIYAVIGMQVYKLFITHLTSNVYTVELNSFLFCSENLLYGSLYLGIFIKHQKTRLFCLPATNTPQITVS